MIVAKINNDSISMMVDEIEIGGINYNVSNYDEILSEYSDSVEDFDVSVMRKFDINLPIVNIEDVFVIRHYRGQKYFRQIVEIGMNCLKQKFNQFALRADSDNNFPNPKLVEVYESVGFIVYQETENDGTIMYMVN